MSLNKTAVPGLIALTVLVVFSLFAPQAQFLQWDDAPNLLHNDKWRSLSWESLKWMFTTRHYGPWQPLSWLSWSFDYQLFGLNPSALRRTNVMLHACTAGLFFFACRRLIPHGKNISFGAAGAALFFALHPLRVESVVWITERRDVLSGLFAVGSILLWLENRRRWSAVAFLCAVLSKGTAIAVVPFIFLADRGARKDWRSMIPHAVIAGFAIVMNLGGFQTGDVRGLDLSLWQRVLVAGSGAWHYLSKTMLPIGLSPYYALPLNGDGIRQESYPGALLALLITAACFRPKVRAWAGPIWISYLLALAPVSGLFQNGRQAAADRYSYLACMPFALLFGYWIERFRPRMAFTILSCVALLLAAATIRQSSYWENDIALWNRAVEVQPEAYLPHSNLAVAYLASGDSVAAIPHLEASIVLEPRDAEARVNLGSILTSRGDFEHALVLFRDAVALRPNDPSLAPARFNLGVLLIQRGQKRDGLAQLREAVRLDPSLEKNLPR